MNDADLALYQQAQSLANAGQTFTAYEMFRGLQSRNPDIEILFGVATTTPNPVEARQVIDTIKRLQPGHPMLARMEALHNQKMEMAYTPVGPALSCRYCGARVPAVVKRKISVGGWVWFAVWFILFLCFMWAPTTVANMSNMEKSAFFCLGVGIIGLLVIRKRTYACGHCGSRITDAS